MSNPSPELPVDQLMHVDTAIALLDAATLPPAREEIVSLESSRGRVLARDVVADRDYPSFEKSLVDGFAVCSADRGPRRVIGRVTPGAMQMFHVEQNDCVAIMTGAPIPQGFDAVVPIEQTDTATFDVTRITLSEEPAIGRFVHHRASEAGVGDRVIRAGTVASAAVIAALATVGVCNVHVVACPRVGVLTTGDEVINLDVPPSKSQIRNSNGPMLFELVGQLGCEAVELGHAMDRPEMIREKLGTPGVDVVLVTGGMSMGAYDYVPRVLKEIGYDLKITKLRIKPGKPFVWATGVNPCAGAPNVFGLPGNPVSAFACTLRLASRLLLRMQCREPEPRWMRAELAGDLPENGPREFYQPAVVDRSGRATVLSWKGSADVFTLARANALLVRPEGDPARRAGEGVRLIEVPQ